MSNLFRHLTGQVTRMHVVHLACGVLKQLQHDITTLRHAEFISAPHRTGNPDVWRTLSMWGTEINSA